MKWVMRERAKVDRIACPWLIKRFVDKDAEFLFVPADRVGDVVRQTGATPFDVHGAELGNFNEGGREFVSFDAVIKKFGPSEPALLEMEKIVRGAVVEVPGAPAESAWLEAAAAGFRLIPADDHENMKLQFPLYDALCRYCVGRLEERAKPGRANRES
jgi:hypothetical protein